MVYSRVNKSTVNKTSGRTQQSGFTLIELLIALVIGLILIAGAMQIYLANKQTYRSQEASSYINNNARFSLYFMQDFVNLAGYKGDPTETNNEAFPADSGITGCGNFSKGEVIADAAGGAGTGLFCVRMKSPANSNAAATDIAQMTDCLGMAIDESDVVTTRFFISANNELSCEAFHANSSGSSQPLVTDITIVPASDLSFGIDSDKNNEVDEYKSSLSASEWSEVIAVNVTMNFSSNSDATGDKVTTVINDAGDYLLRKSISRTFALRSRTNPQP